MSSKYRFLLIEAFHLANSANHSPRSYLGPKEETLMNYAALAPLLVDVDWERHPGPLAQHGDWPVETREEFMTLIRSRNGR